MDDELPINPINTALRDAAEAWKQQITEARRLAAVARIADLQRGSLICSEQHRGETMHYTETNELASQIERLARRLPEGTPLAVSSLLDLAATILRGDDAQASLRLTQVLSQIDALHLISVAALQLERRAASGNLDARDAAAMLNTAGLILTTERE